MLKKILSGAIVAALIMGAPVALAQATDPAVIAEQKAAMAKLDKVRGEWRGTVTTRTPSGSLQLIQTERVGPMLDGTLLAIEGRGYRADGTLAFNAFAVISFDTVSDQYSITSWTGGHSGKFPLTPTDAGFDWTVTVPNGAKITYRASVADGKWSEVGTFAGNGTAPVDFVQLDVERIGDTAWPAAGFVPPKP